MTNQQTLEKAIAKAIEGGWTPWIFTKNPEYLPQAVVDNANWAQIIFNQDFARCLWGYGNNKKCIYCGTEMWIMHPQPYPYASLPTFAIKPLWQYHLQQMAIADDPIAYLGANLPQ